MTAITRTGWTTVVAVVAACLGARVSAQQSRTATLVVVAEVVADCNISVGPLVFGPYDPVEANRTTALDGATVVNLTCTKGTIAEITMDDGRHAPAGNQRAMAGPGGQTLQYELYLEAARATRWGLSGAGLRLPASASTAFRALTVYGRVPPGQDVQVGTYEDEVVVSVRF